MSSIYDFKAKSLKGEEIDLADLKGKVVLVVNTASKCGFTPQYEGLQALHEKYGNDGLAVLGFPCNQFGGQEPGAEDDIQEFCQVNYGVDFQMFEKVDVNGGDAHPLFNYLKKALPGFPGNGIKWNFTKFLIDKDGTPIKRYNSMATPKKIEPEIQKLLG